MSNFKPSIYQQAIFDFALKGQGNAVIKAVAGSGKTTTIVQLLQYLPKEDSKIFLAFNKSIVNELKERVSKDVKVQTMHSLGWTAILKSGRKPILNDKKVYNIIDLLNPYWAKEDGVEVLENDYNMRVKKLVDLAKNNLVSEPAELEILAKRHDVELLNGECKRAIEVLKKSWNEKREYDFCDMLFCASVDDNIKLDTYKWILVDECQDLNKAQQKLLKKIMAEDSRFIAVGDPQQAIYGFTGSDTESFRTLESIPNTITLPLSVNYRCGKNIINLAQGLVPQLEAFEGSKMGEIDYDASYKNITDGDMVLCRNTAPLVKLCLQYIAQGTKAYVKGGDIGTNLINLVKKTKKETLDEVFKKLDADLDLILEKLRKKYPTKPDQDLMEESAFRLLQDKINVLTIISDSNESVKLPKDLMNTIQAIFADEKAGICLSTIHKAKGLEASRVYIIDRELMPSKYSKQDWQKEQESNLEYVAYTRAKDYLGFVSDWTGSKRK